MTDHDPLCPANGTAPTTSGTCWQCDLIARVRADEPDWLELTLALDEAKAQRDIARAEADKWQTLAVAAQMARDDLLAEVATLRSGERRQRWAGVWERDIRREVLADLRAKVEALGLCIEPDDGEDECFCNDVALYAANRTLDKILALIEEVGR